MALSEPEQDKADAALGRALVLGLSEVLRASIKAQVLLREEEPDEAIQFVEQELYRALEQHEVDVIATIAAQRGTRADIKERIKKMVRAAVVEAANELDIRPPARPGSH